MKSDFGGGSSSWLLNEYLASSGTKAEIKEYACDRELIEAARKGEIDLVLGNDLVSLILAYEGNLVDLDSVIGGYVGAGTCYDKVLEAGQINGSFLIAVPFFLVTRESEILVPRGAVEEAGGEPRTMAEFLSLFDSLEAKDRSRSGPMLPDMLLESLLDLPGKRVGGKEAFGAWTTLEKKLEEDLQAWLQETQNGNASDRMPLFSYGKEIDPVSWKGLYQENGQTYSKYGSDAVLIPLPTTGEAGFALNTASQSIPKAAAHREAAMAFLAWEFSEEGQRKISSWEAHGGGSWYTVNKDVNREKIERYLKSFMDSAPDGKALQEAIEETEKCLEKTDRLAPLSFCLKQSFSELLRLRSAGAEERERWRVMMKDGTMGAAEDAEKAFSLLTFYVEKMEEEAPRPRYFEDGTFEDWPEYLADFLADYLADLGLEATKEE
ncbi:MAG: extracellular solute-binding protein [Clostridia bacterium]|nr:extracellular solute-binding protein [Clostridia bacterium]